MNTRTPVRTPTNRRGGRTSPQTRVPIKRTAASILAAVLIAIIGFAAVQPTQPAEAQSTTSLYPRPQLQTGDHSDPHSTTYRRILVKNINSGNNGDEHLNTQYPKRAQAFTTGNNPTGYHLSDIGVRFRSLLPSTAGAHLKVTLNEATNDGNPGHALCTLKDPANFSSNAVAFFTAPTTEASACPMLRPQTTYFVLVNRVTGDSTIRITTTNTNAQDSDSISDWEIADNHFRISQSGSRSSRSQSLKINVRGIPEPTLTAIGALTEESGDPNNPATMTFQIFLDQKGKRTITVDYATQDGTAKAGVNYTQTSGTVTFAPREQVKTVDVDILDDGEGGSTYFMLVLSNPKGAGLRANHPGTGRILDTLPLFRTWDASAYEGNTTISFVVEFNHRDPGDTADYTVDYRTEDITATAGADYESTSGTLTFTPADGDLVVPVTIKDDDIQDNGETFRLVLSNPSSGVTLHRTAATAIGTILNHDSEGLTATFPASAYASKSHKGPNDRPQVVVAFNSSVASISATTPSVVVNGASITSVQAHTEDGLQNAQIFFLEPDGNDDITFTLVANVACASGGICSGTGTPITQVPAAHTIPAKQTATVTSQLSVADAAASEEDDSTIDFVIRLNPADDGAVSVEYATSDGSAKAGSDYTGTSGTLTFAPGETAKTVAVAILDDDTEENDETLTLTLSNAPNAEIKDTTATGTITDNEADEQAVETTPTLSISGGSGKERDDDEIDFIVTLDEEASDTVTVDYATADGTADAGDDYTAKSGTLSFSAGETSKTISIAIKDDTLNESDETFTVTLSNASGAELETASATGTIRNRHVEPLTASFSNMPTSHDGSTEFTFDLTFSENFPLSYKTLRDHAFTEDDNGPITKAQRKVQGSNQTWTITVDPSGNGAITITLPETTDCTANGAICTDDGRKLSHFTTVTVSGPG